MNKITLKVRECSTTTPFVTDRIEIPEPMRAQIIKQLVDAMPDHHKRLAWMFVLTIDLECYRDAMVPDDFAVEIKGDTEPATESTNAH